MNTEKIGKFIASKRKEKNMTQKELAQKIGTTDRIISKWERGRGYPDVSLLDELSNVLDVSVVEILKGETVEHPEIMEKDLVDSMKYTKELAKKQVAKKISLISAILVILLSIFIVFCNLLNSYFLNRTFDVTDNLDNSYKTLATTFKNKANIVLQNQGTYTDEDYAKIVKYVTKLQSRFNSNTEKYLTKDKYTIKDIFDFTEYYDDNLNENFIDNPSLYHTLIKYDTSVSKNLETYYYIKNINKSRYVSLAIGINNTGKYNFSLTETSALYVMSIVSSTYQNEIMLLEDIIEVGDLNA